MNRRVRLLISGRVQGVFFRTSAARVARSLGLDGCVRNLPDGRVECIAEGEEEKLKRMIEWSQHGPPGARVEEVDVGWHEATREFRGFQIY